MNKFKYSFFLICFFVFFLISCGISPPDDMKKSDFMDLSETIASNVVDFLHNFSAFDYMNSGIIPKKGIFVCYKNDEIYFNQSRWDKTDKPKTPYIFQSGSNGKIEIMRDIYLAEIKKNRMIYSFDKIKWYATDGDPKEFENFYPMLEMDWDRALRRIDFNFKWAIREGSNPKVEVFQIGQKPILNLEPGLLIDSEKNKKNAVDLHNNIVFIPKGTLIQININLGSNFLIFKRFDKDSALFTAIEDVYLYRKGMILSVSFDGNYWGDTFFSYKFDFDSSIYVDVNGQLCVDQIGNILNKKLLKRQKRNEKK